MHLGKNNWFAAGLLGAALCAGCGTFKKTAKAPGVDTNASNSAEPDKVLFEKASKDLKKGNTTVGRLEMQTLLNTYQDSEYQAKAKLAIADSYFKEGGQSNLTQAIAQYQDFITFFPFLDEAAYAQSQIGMAHYRAMEKPDRDRTEALEAEGAFQTFLQKYPDSPLRPQMEQRLRDVQEVLAEGDFRVANFYYIRGVYLASAARLAQLIERYPLYSQADRANWMLGSIYEKTEHNEYAGKMYGQIITNYPLSPLASQAKDKLVKFGMPVPQPDPAAMARMRTEQNQPRARGSFATAPLGMLKNAPDVSMAARTGQPTMTPEDNGGSTNALVSGTGSTTLAAAPSAAGAGTGAYVETVTPGSSGSSSSASSSAPAEAPSSAPSSTDASTSTQPPSQSDAASSSAGETNNSFNPGASDAAPAGASTAGSTTPASGASSSSSAPAASGATSQGESSSSKKKKKKLLVF